MLWDLHPAGHIPKKHNTHSFSTLFTAGGRGGETYAHYCYVMCIFFADTLLGTKPGIMSFARCSSVDEAWARPCPPFLDVNTE